MMWFWWAGALFTIGLCNTDEGKYGLCKTLFCVFMTMLIWPYILGLAVSEMYDHRNEVTP